MPQVAGQPPFQNLGMYRVIGENIKKMREEIPISQTKFAEYIGISNTCLCRIEAGEYRTEYALVKTIADIFGTTSDVLAIKDSYRKLRESRKNLDRIFKLLSEPPPPPISTPPLPVYRISFHNPTFTFYSVPISACIRLKY